jgi:hypothetical protein
MKYSASGGAFAQFDTIVLVCVVESSLTLGACAWVAAETAEATRADSTARNFKADIILSLSLSAIIFTPC